MAPFPTCNWAVLVGVTLWGVATKESTCRKKYDYSRMDMFCRVIAVSNLHIHLHAGLDILFLTFLQHSWPVKEFWVHPLGNALCHSASPTAYLFLAEQAVYACVRVSIVHRGCDNTFRTCTNDFGLKNNPVASWAGTLDLMLSRQLSSRCQSMFYC